MLDLYGQLLGSDLFALRYVDGKDAIGKLCVDRFLIDVLRKTEGPFERMVVPFVYQITLVLVRFGVLRTGEMQHMGTIRLDTLKKMNIRTNTKTKLVTTPAIWAMTADFHCVEGWSVPDLAWKGLRLSTLAELAGPRPEARYVIFHALGGTRSRPGGLDHYVECLPLADLLDPALGYLLALDLDGAPVPLAHGAPLRLVCPFDLAYKAIKFVTRLEFSDTAQDGWWTRANGIYTAFAPVEPERLRVRDPRSLR